MKGENLRGIDKEFIHLSHLNCLYPSQDHHCSCQRVKPLSPNPLGFRIGPVSMDSSHRRIYAWSGNSLSNNPHPLFPFLMNVKAMDYRQQCQNMNGTCMSKLLFESCLGENCPVTTLLCDPKINLCDVNILL